MKIIGSHVKGALCALTLTLSGVLVLALLVKYSGVSVGVIMPATQVIKALSIFFGVLIAIRSFEKRAFINGGILGIVYTAVAFLALSVIDKSFSPIEGLFAEIVFAAVVGALSSMLLRLRKSNV